MAAYDPASGFGLNLLLTFIDEKTAKRSYILNPNEGWENLETRNTNSSSSEAFLGKINLN